MVPRLPQFDYIEGVSVYQDTDQDYKFYVISDAPRLRYGGDGKPVFLFLKYRFSPDEVAENAPRGGGFLAFDCDLSIPDAKMKTVRAKLQDWVNQKYQSSGTPPPVQVATLPWVDDDKTSVQVAVLGNKQGGNKMVTSIVGAGKPSLLGSNVASFAVALDQQGADLMWQACQMEEIPINVYYDVKFLAQIPTLKMFLWLHASQLHQYYEHISEAIDDPGCGSDTDQNYTRYMQENFSKWGIADVEITDWPADLGTNADDVEKFKQQMIQEGWALIEDQLKDGMKDKFDPTKDADKGQAGGFQDTVRNYLQTYDTDLELFFNRQSVVKWPVHPQALLQGIFSTPGPDGKVPNKADYFKQIDLKDDWFQMVQVRAYCNADFENDPIYSVKVHIAYGDTVQDLLFTDNKSTQLFQAFVQKDLGRNYKYWTEVNYKNSDRIFRGPETTTDETRLVLSVKEFGYLKLQIFAGRINWDVIESAQIHIRYGDDANQVPLEEEVVQLTKSQTSSTYQRLIWAPMANPYQYQANFFLKDGQKVLQDWVSSVSLQLIINDMFEDHLAVKVLATGGFDRITKIVVDLDYEDPDHSYNQQQTLELTADQDYLSWTIPIYKGANKDFRYRSLTLYKDGHTDQQEWQKVTGSLTLMVGPTFVDYLIVNVVPDLVDFNQVKLVKVGLHYTDSAHNIDASEDFVFTKDKKSGQTWKYGIMDKAKKQYTYNATYYLTDATQRETPDTSVSDDTIILQMPVAAQQAPVSPGQAPAPG